MKHQGSFAWLVLCTLWGSGCGSEARAAASPPNESTAKSPPSAAATAPTPVGERGKEQAEAPSATTTASAGECDAAERQLLLHLRERQQQLDVRERAIVDHEAVLGRIETELAGRLQAVVADVQRMEDHVKPALAAKQARDQQKADALLAALATLPARKASAIITKAEPEIASMLLGQLGPDKSAAILAAMEPAAAAALVQRLVKPAGKSGETDAGVAAKPRGGKENQ